MPMHESILAARSEQSQIANSDSCCGELSPPIRSKSKRFIVIRATLLVNNVTAPEAQ